MKIVRPTPFSDISCADVLVLILRSETLDMDDGGQLHTESNAHRAVSRIADDRTSATCFSHDTIRQRSNTLTL